MVWVNNETKKKITHKIQAIFRATLNSTKVVKETILCIFLFVVVAVAVAEHFNTHTFT